MIYRPQDLPNTVETIALWQKWAVDAGLPGIHFVGMCNNVKWNPLEHGFDAKVVAPHFEKRPWISRRKPLLWLKSRINRWRGLPTIYDYKEIMSTYEAFLKDQIDRSQQQYPLYPCLIHSWDNTPRSGANGVVCAGATPDCYGKHVQRMIGTLSKSGQTQPLMFLKAWNEWAEGNHLEPDLRHGHAWLDVLKTALKPPTTAE